MLREAGFTLIELLVVITLVGIIGTLTTQVFILGIKLQGKSEIAKDVKQNGDYTVSVIEAMVKAAVDIESGCNQSANTFTIKNSDGLMTTFSCLEQDKIASIAAGFPEPTPSVAYSLTGGRVEVLGCATAFRVVCPTPPLSPKYVLVNFIISQKGSGLTPTPGSFSSLEYQTTVSLRGYQ